MKQNGFLPGMAALSAAMALAAAAGAAPGDAVTDPRQAGPAYGMQGEYAGAAGGQRLGADVIDLGKGTFQAVFFPGGLPGEGWDGKTRVRVDGRMEGDVPHFAQSGAKWTAAISGGGATAQGGGQGYELVQDGPIVQVVPRGAGTSGGGTGGRRVLAGRTESGEQFQLTRTVRRSPTLGMKPPAGARVLFDGKSADAWNGGKMTPDGLLQCGPTSKQSFKDFTAHFEFRLPYMPEARGQGRGNSGVYLQNRYEVQVLDSFGLKGEDNECAGLYHQKAPDVNMCYPPLTWQTYDIDFQAARFDGDKKVKPAVLTLRHNGVVVHEHVELNGPTPGGQPETAAPGPFQLQNHGNPVVYRNIWVVERQ
jgi:hypothetical protein